MDTVLLWIGSFTAFATLCVPFIIEFFFSKIWNPEDQNLKIVMTFVISIALAFIIYGVGNLFGIGFLVGAKILKVIASGIGAGLLANFAWIKIEWIKAIISAFFDKELKKNN